MKLIFAKENIENYKKLITYSIQGNLYSLLDIINYIKNNFHSDNYANYLCKMKFYEIYNEKEEKAYKFLENYNNNPELKIEESDKKNFLLIVEESNNCYCQYSKYELINLIQKLEKKMNENDKEISNLNKLINEKEESYKRQINRYSEINNSLKGIKENNERLTYENLRHNNTKIKLENEIKKLKNDENNNTLKYKNEIKKLNQIIKDENEKNNKISEDLTKKHKEEIKNIISQKDESCNRKIYKLEEEKNDLVTKNENLNNEILNLKEEYKSEIEKLNQEKEENEKYYENEIKNHEEEIKNYNSKISDYEKEIDKLNYENNKNKEIYENGNEELKLLKNKHEKDLKNFNDEISNLKNEYEEKINKLNNEKEDNKKKYENENEKKLGEINKLKNKHQEELEKLREENKNLKMEGEILGNVEPRNLMMLKKMGFINNINLKTNFIEIDSDNKIKLNNDGQNDKPSENFYDLIIDINSIKDIDKGWQMKMNDKGLENYKNHKNEKVIKIGIIGNSNKGKSFILSKLSQIKLPSGADIRTEGLSVKYPDIKEYKNRKIVLLDSAGLETPVLVDEIKEYMQEEEFEINQESKLNNSKEFYNEHDNKENTKIKSKDICEKAFKEKSREKIMTELFLQNYIMHNSDILILVVGILSYSEQKLINRIKTEMKNQKIEKPLYIIHNLILYDTVDKVEKHIKDVLMKCATFKLEKAENISMDKAEETGYHFHEKNSNSVIYHLIMANDLSSAGEYYNPYTIKFIENSFQYLHNLKCFDIIETLKERLITLSKDYFEKPLLKNQLLDNESIFKNKLFTLKKSDEDLNEDENTDNESEDKEESKSNKKKYYLYNDKIGKKGIQLKCCLIDELGFSNFKGNGFVPKYNWFENGEQISLRVEIPGNYTISCGKIKNSGEYTIIPINGEKKTDSIPKKIEDNVYTTREFGRFEVEIYLPTEKYCIKREKVKPIVHNGVAIFDFNLQNEEINNEASSFNEL